MKTLALFLVLFSPGIEAILKSRSAKPAIIEKPINVTYNAMKMHEALKITNEAMIIRILCDKTSTQRMQIKDKYRELYNKDLTEVLNAKLWSDTQYLINSLLLDKDWYITRWVRGLLGRPHVQGLLEILSTRNAEELNVIKYKYYQMYYEHLQYHPHRENMKDEELFVTYIVQQTRSDIVNSTLAINDVEMLMNKGNTRDRWTTFIDIFTSRSFEQLKIIFDLYFQHTATKIEDTIRDKFSKVETRTEKQLKESRIKAVHEVLLDIVTMAYNPAAFYVDCIRRTMKGLFTGNNDLTYFLVTRAELDLHSIREEWDVIEEESLYDWIIDDTSGYFREALLAILEGNRYD